MNLNPIPFNRPPHTGNEDQYVLRAMQSNKLSGDGEYTRQCHSWFERVLGCPKALLTPSCTHALEMAALLIDIQPGDEVIMPSYTFVSTANAFALRGAKIVFVDIRPDTMNIDETMIEGAITARTKAIVPVHYAGVACEMSVIMEIATRHDLFVIEDAAQGVMSSYRGRLLGSIGHLAAYSFHDTKNLTSGGEGGMLVINDDRFVARAEIIREKGTNRSLFYRGMVDKYSWVDLGSSYLPSELQAAYLWGQLEQASYITENRLNNWNQYLDALKPLERVGSFTLPVVPPDCAHNGHLFYIKTKDLYERTELLGYLNDQGIHAAFHYVPLHSAPIGHKFSRFHELDRFTTKESECLIRLPMWFGMTPEIIASVVQQVATFYRRLD
ncbi:MAG: dTDP-4-amino-4,6-dideoxygalactose transaminase [Glaciimonas sp.]|nr:dTDP-4-amino-4,6-dideoxygalactose transaminase [Glaciimonas sp.]